ncbi:hypothetical protein J7L48_10380 [bacterium]|nr:hypothetical protein [bacterium]
MAIVILLFIGILLYYYQKKYKKIKEEHEHLEKEVSVLSKEVENFELYPDHYERLKETVNLMLIPYEGLKEELHNSQKKIEKLVNYFNSNENFLHGKLEYLAAISLKEHEFDFGSIEDINMTSFIHDVIDFEAFENKIFGLGEDLEQNKEFIDELFEFINSIIGNLVKQKNYMSNLEMIFDNLKLIFLNIQLEAVKKGEVAKEFLVIGEEIKDIYEQGNETVASFKTLFSQIEYAERILDHSKSLKILVEKLIENFASLISTYQELKDRYEIQRGYDKQNEREVENIAGNYKDIVEKYSNFVIGQKEFSAGINSYLRKINNTLGEIKTFREWVKEIKKELGVSL